MTSRVGETKGAFSVVGIGLAACVACCAGPILAFLGGLSLAGAASSLFLGLGGLVVAVVASAAFLLLRHRRGRRRATPIEAVPVASPVRRA